MNEDVSRRRSKMLRLLAKGSPISVVAEPLSKEYNCSPAAIIHDYNRLNVWSHSVSKDMEFTGILENISDKNNDKALRVTIEQIGLIQELRLSGNQSLKIKENVSVKTPFEADPDLRKVLLDSNAKQKAEKGDRDAAKNLDDPRH